MGRGEGAESGRRSNLTFWEEKALSGVPVWGMHGYRWWLLYLLEEL